ncbi:MAG: associated domain protein [Chloroflexi bacterium]|nr:associated domain protein [Chloroflexota bacterium]
MTSSQAEPAGDWLLDGAARDWLEAETGIARGGAEQIVEYVAETKRMLGVVPSTRTVVAERFFDESGGMQLVLHAPFGGRINRAWGLALRKRFCVTFDFELQAAATDDGLVISLGEQHSFPLDSVFGMVRPATMQADLTQAALQSPMFTNRWRWNASRALALPRLQNGRRVPMNIQRMRAEDLLAAVFPAQLSCQDNHPGRGLIELPDHPLVNETIDNCLHEAMDIDGLRTILEAIASGEIRTAAVETPVPSPMSHEILNANPYAYLDDAPLEERRARAVSLRRTDPDLASGIGALDPEAIALVQSQAWPDVRDAEELHDVLLSLGVLPEDDLAAWRPYADELIANGRVTTVRPESAAERRWIVAAERIQMIGALYGSVVLDPPMESPPGVRTMDRDEAIGAVVQGWMEALGPTTAEALADRLGLPVTSVAIGLAALEGRGVVLRGQFTVGVGGQGPGARGNGGGAGAFPPTPDSRPLAPLEWCERRLLARIHRLTIGRLRQEIEPVSPADFIRFLLRWQHVAAGTQVHGRDGLATIVRQLQGIELPAPAWEASVLSARVARYSPTDLEELCLSGVVAWGRLSSRPADDEGTDRKRPRRWAPSRQAPLAFALRDALSMLREPAADPAPASIPMRVGPATRQSVAASRLAPIIGGPRTVERNGHGAATAPDSAGAGRATIPPLSSDASTVYEYLERRGASFMADLVRGTGLLPAAVEDALWELVAQGLASGDGVAGLRVLLQPEQKRQQTMRHLRSIAGGRSAARPLPVGRWSIWKVADAEPPSEEERTDFFARALLRRYGVVFRDLIARERQAPPWRLLLRVYRSLEARGQIRGGRFVAGYVGEQYALPEAVEALRAVRRAQKSGEIALVSAGDPLNLVGIITPGSRVSPYSNQIIAYRDGVPVEVGTLGSIQSSLQIANLRTATGESR